MAKWISGYEVADDGEVSTVYTDFPANEVRRMDRIAEGDKVVQWRVTLKDDLVFEIDVELSLYLTKSHETTIPASEGYFAVFPIVNDFGFPDYSLYPVVGWKLDDVNGPSPVCPGLDPGDDTGNVLAPDGRVYCYGARSFIPFAEWFGREAYCFARDLKLLDVTKIDFDLKPDSLDDPIECRLPLKPDDKMSGEDFAAYLLENLGLAEASAAAEGVR